MMLGFVQSWFSPRSNPIGIDFGTDCLRLAQVHWTGQEYKLIAAGSADIPPHVRSDNGARTAFFVENVRDLIAQCGFHGRQVILALPAACMFVRHLRMPKLDEDEMTKSLPWELRGKLPIDPMHAVLRHMIAGEVYQDQDPKYEVIVLAAARDRVDQLLAAAGRAKLDVVGMNVEPRALIDCFSHLYRRQSDETATTFYVDIGCSASRAMITRGQEMLFARVIPIGGDHFTHAVADALKLNAQDAKILRRKLSAQQLAVPEEARSRLEADSTEAAPQAQETPDDHSFALLDSALPKADASAAENASRTTSTADSDLANSEPSDQQRPAHEACQEPIHRLVEELNLCRRYYESTFPDKPIDRLIFVGGEACQRALCQQVAREMGLAAQIGDPLVRMGRIGEVGVECGIDRRQPQPAWAVAIGLSMGARGTGKTADASRAETLELTKG